MRSDIETLLRSTFDEQARRAPSGDALAELILAEVSGATPLRHRRRLRTWTLPLLAAAAVAAVIAAVVGISQWETTSAPAPGATQLPTGPRPTPPTSSSPTVVAPLSTFRARDLTFTSGTQGWALGTAPCPSGSGDCAAIATTTDGTHWAVDPQLTVPPGVQQLRFANSQVGYAFGPSTLFMSTDGGRSWRRQAGGALALESENNNVIRIASSGTGCPAACNVRAEVSTIGGTAWTSTPIEPADGYVGGVEFARGGEDAYILITNHPSGGGSRAYSTLFVTRNNGATWQRQGEPCPQPGATEADSTTVAAAPDGRVSVLCAVRGTSPSTNAFVAVSTDAGRTFHRAAGRLPASSLNGSELLAGDPSGSLIFVGRAVYRSIDGGTSWSRVLAASDVVFVGFESPTTGRLVSDSGRRVWTTSDGGAHWTAAALP